jgi:hypothetical protein
MLRVVNDALHGAEDRGPGQGRRQEQRKEDGEYAARKRSTSLGDRTVHETSPASRVRDE